MMPVEGGFRELVNFISDSTDKSFEFEENGV